METAFIDVTTPPHDGLKARPQHKAPQTASQLYTHMQSTLIDQIQGLRESATEANKSFKLVKTSLQVIDLNPKLSENRTKFVDEWTTLQKRWRALLLQSRQTATKAEAYIRDFTEVIIPMVRDARNSDDLTECRQELDHFMKRNDTDSLTFGDTSRMAQEHSESFGKLRDDVEAFKTRFISWIPLSELRKLNKELREADSKEESLEKMRRRLQTARAQKWSIPLFDELQRCVQMLDRYSHYLGYIVAGSAVACAIISFVSPVALTILGGGVMLAGCAAGYVIVGGLLSQYRDKRLAQKGDKIDIDLSHLHLKQERLKGEWSGLSKLKRRMDAQRPGMDKICVSIDGFQTAWDSVQHDAYMIANSLGDMVSSSSSSVNAFKRRMEVIQADNVKLARALREFATVVHRTTSE